MEKDRWRWELRWSWRNWRFGTDFFLDGGSREWCFGPLTVYRWIVRPVGRMRMH